MYNYKSLYKAGLQENLIAEEKGIVMTEGRCHAASFEDGGGPTCYGMWVASRSGKGKGMDFTPEPCLGGTSPANNLPSVQWDWLWTFYFHNCKRINLHGIKLLSLWQFVISSSNRKLMQWGSVLWTSFHFTLIKSLYSVSLRHIIWCICFWTSQSHNSERSPISGRHMDRSGHRSWGLMKFSLRASEKFSGEGNQ